MGKTVRTAVLIALAAVVAFSAQFASAADPGHAGHDMKQHGEMKGKAAHEEVVDGVKATFKVQTMADAMKAMGMEMPKGVKETHHVSVTFTDAKTGAVITDGEAKLKVQAPDKTAETKDLMAMHGHFGADVLMAKKGKYGIMAKFKVKDGKVRQVKFWYQLK
jgi:hypothetical protein